MKYQNPIVRGFYPDPSICAANGKFYLVTSSFQYFPGVPLFESDDLINWKQIGHVLSDLSQVELHKVRSSGGVFAPTIRFNNGRFYMVTNNNSTDKNFYVYTDDIYGKWSAPIEVDQGGIDPSLYFEDGRTYFISNGTDDEGRGGVIQCEIDIETGEKRSESKCIWTGAGGRYIESPHMYKIGDYYYLVVAEGGTEYGHMVAYARSKNVWGPFENYPANPVLTNRNKAPFIIQGIGHGDLIQANDGSWYIVTLGFRQIGMWMAYHNLGRETFLTPVYFNEDGWFTAGKDGTTDLEYEIPGDFEQIIKNEYTFANTKWDMEWIYLRDADFTNYTLTDDSATLRGTDITLEEADAPTFLGIRQLDFVMDLGIDIEISEQTAPKLSAKTGEAGITIYMCETEHYDIGLAKTADGYEAILKLNLGQAKHTLNRIPIKGNQARLIVRADGDMYRFFVDVCGTETALGMGDVRYMTSEVAGGFTGVVMGMYAIGDCEAKFTEFKCVYQ